MEILKSITVPTGEIYTAKGKKGLLNFLQLATMVKMLTLKLISWV